MNEVNDNLIKKGFFARHIEWSIISTANKYERKITFFSVEYNNLARDIICIFCI